MLFKRNSSIDTIAPIGFFWTALAAITPALYMVPFVYSYIFTQKTFFCLVVIAGIGPLIVALLQRAAIPPRSLFMFSFIIFLASLGISTLFSIDHMQSLIGTWQRFGGYRDWFLCFIYFLMLISFIQSDRSWIWFFKLTLQISTGIALWGIFQHFSVLNIFYQGSQVFSTLGNPNFLASYLILSLGISLYIYNQSSLYYRGWCGVCILIQCYALILTRSHSAIGGIIIALTIFIIGLIISRIGFLAGFMHAVKKGKLISILTLFFVGMLAVFFMSSVYSTKYGTLQSRYYNWNIAGKGFIERPVAGWGESTYTIIFQRYFNPKLFLDTQNTTWFDRAHNEYLDRLAMGGVIGFSAYIVFMCALIAIAMRHAMIRTTVNHTWPMLVAVLSYCIYLFFNFHSLADTMLLIVYAAFLFSMKKN